MEQQTSFNEKSSRALIFPELFLAKQTLERQHSAGLAWQYRADDLCWNVISCDLDGTSIPQTVTCELLAQLERTACPSNSHWRYARAALDRG